MRDIPLKRVFHASLRAAFLAIVVIFGINVLILLQTKALIFRQVADVPARQTALVLGAKVSKAGIASPILEDRLATALELYETQKVQKLLVSGDHGRAEYDEVRAMRNYLVEHGVPVQDIFMDHAGFDTYDSVYRARDVFQVKDLVIVTQGFHLPRALYIAKRLGVNAIGITSDKRAYTAAANRRNALREPLARVKAWGDVTLHARPRFLGEPIPITGDGTATDDKVAQ